MRVFKNICGDNSKIHADEIVFKKDGNIITVPEAFSWSKKQIINLENGWSGELYCSKNDGLGLAHLYGRLKAGDISPGALISYIPEEFCPIKLISISVYDTMRGMSYVGLYLTSDGHLRIRRPATDEIGSNGTPVVNTLYRI